MLTSRQISNSSAFLRWLFVAVCRLECPTETHRMSKSAAKLMARSDEVAGTYVRKRYAILFYLLLFTFVASPVLAALQRRSIFIEALLATTLSVAVLPMRTGSARRILLVL